MTDLPGLPELRLMTSTDWQDYKLLDSGSGETLERLGPYKLIRPEPQAIWSRGLPDSMWESADAFMVSTGGEHGGYWEFTQPIKQPWVIDYKGLKCEIHLSKSRHIGIFPEQAAQWDWIEEQIRSAKRPLKVINLFGYTGMATAAAAHAGAQVTHVDASKHAVSWASRNLALSGAKRQSFYDGIILDPPKFGRGPSGKVWSYLEDIAELLALCRCVLTKSPRFICLTSYAIQASALVPHQALQDLVKGFGGKVTSGELVTIDKSQGKILSHSLYSHWSSEEE